MSERASAEEKDALWSRLRVIEGQPLPERAGAYAAMHEEISRRLDSGPPLDDPSGDGIGGE